MRPKYEVADIFCRYGEEYKNNHCTNDEQRKVMAAIMACRTAQLGGHQEVCELCGTIRNCYNSCRNRHCPKCQTMAKETWLAKRREELLPCDYFHIVFTVPHELNPYILANRRELLSDLFTTIKQILFAFSADPQWKLEGKPGILAVLHTWSQTLIDHFHIHCLIPAGVLSFDNRRWIKSNDAYLFRVQSLAKAFKKRYLQLIEKKSDSLVVPKNSTRLLQKAWGKNWIVYAKKPFEVSRRSQSAGPKHVLEYLGRYTHRIAISNHRIKSIDNGRVVFTYRDRADNNKQKTMSLDASEFIRRFLLHVLPSRFMKIRYYGFLANICKKKSILLIRRLIGRYMEVQTFIEETTRKKVLRLTGRDIFACPVCAQGTMVLFCSLPRLNSS